MKASYDSRQPMRQTGLLLALVASLVLLGANTLPSSGNTTITRLSPALSPDTAVRWFLIHPSGQSVVFAIGSMTTTTSLYRVPIGGGPATTLQFTPTLTSTLSQITPVGISAATNQVIVSRDGYIDPQFPTNTGLYGIPLDGGAPIQLTPAIGPGSYPHAVTLTPDGTRLVYLGRTAAGTSLFPTGAYSTRADGSAAPVRLSPDPGPSNISVSRYWLAPDGSRVMFAFPLTQAGNDLLSVPVDGPASAAVQVNRPLTAPQSGINTDTGSLARCSPSCVQITPDGQRVIFWLNPDLVSAPIMGPASAGITLTAPLTVIASINYVLSGGGDHVGYLRGATMQFMSALNGVPVSGPIAATVLLSAQPAFVNGEPVLAAAGSRVIYQTGFRSLFQDSQREIWSVPFAGPSTAAQRLSLGSTVDFVVSPQGNWLLYSTNAFEPHDWYVVSTTGPALSRNLLGPALGQGSLQSSLFVFSSDETRVVAATSGGDLVSLPLSVGLSGAERLTLTDYVAPISFDATHALSADDRYAVYLAKPRSVTASNPWELFSAQLPAAPTPTPTPTRPAAIVRILLPALSK